MTNAEKFAEVFGVEPDRSECARYTCDGCPASEVHQPACSYLWWSEDYKGVVNNG